HGGDTCSAVAPRGNARGICPSEAKPVQPTGLILRPTYQAKTQIVGRDADRATATLGVPDEKAGGRAMLAFEHAYGAGRLFAPHGAGGVELDTPVTGVSPFPDIAGQIHDAKAVGAEATQRTWRGIGRPVAGGLLAVIGDPAQGGIVGVALAAQRIVGIALRCRVSPFSIAGQCPGLAGSGAEPSRISGGILVTDAGDRMPIETGCRSRRTGIIGHAARVILDADL